MDSAAGKVVNWHLPQLANTCLHVHEQLSVQLDMQLHTSTLVTADLKLFFLPFLTLASSIDFGCPHNKNVLITHETRCVNYLESRDPVLL